MTNNKIKNILELKNIVEDLKKQNKVIVTTNGVFDILHIGHIRYLQEAKKLGNILIVAVNSDNSTKKIKGPERPKNNENDRAETLAALECVDFVTIFDEENPIKFLEEIKPDFHVKGGDYKPEEIIEKDVVIKNGGKVHLIDKIEGYSTTSFIHRIQKSTNDENHEK